MFDEKHMRNVAKELKEAFDFFLTDRVSPHSITVGNTYMIDRWCILIDNWLIIVPCEIDIAHLKGVDAFPKKDPENGYELQVVTVKSNYPHEPEYIDYAIIGKYKNEVSIIDATLKYILNNAMEAYGEMKCYEKMAKEDPTKGVW